MSKLKHIEVEEGGAVAESFTLRPSPVLKNKVGIQGRSPRAGGWL